MKDKKDRKQYIYRIASVFGSEGMKSIAKKL